MTARPEVLSDQNTVARVEVAPRLFTIVRAAAYLGCGRGRVYKLIETGHLRPVRVGDGPAKIDVRDLDALIERSKGKGPGW